VSVLPIDLVFLSAIVVGELPGTVATRSPALIAMLVLNVDLTKGMMLVLGLLRICTPSPKGHRQLKKESWRGRNCACEL
jgi:hypothetical protein